MKKLFSSLLALLFLANTLSAQAFETPEKALKAASKAYSSYQLDQKGNATKLDEAAKAIDFATASDALKGDVKTWMTAGNIYSELVNRADLTLMLTKKPDPTFNPSVAVTAYKAYKTALGLATKKWDKADAVKGLMDAMNKVRNAGSTLYQGKKYADAYEAFAAVPDINKLMVANGEKSPLTQADINTYSYYAASSAQQAGKNDEAYVIYKGMYDAKADSNFVYDNLYKMTIDKDEAQALKYLEEGVAKYPKDNNLLFGQINYYLKKNKLNELLDKLKVAIEREPNNLSLYSTLGGVYDNLYQAEIKAGGPKASEYFDNALNYYNQALAKDSKNFDSNYSAGALHYNKAAGLIAEANKLGDDMSAAGLKKYEAKAKEAKDAFNVSLPFFKKAEAMNANDKNTLIALKEIFARLDDFTSSNEFKKRIEVLDSGKKNEASFFKL